MDAATVVVPALNAGSTLSAQLCALDRQRCGRRFDVIVVDNGSIDNTAEIAQNFASTRYELRIVTESRRGTNRARNAGIAAAPPGIILLCDADDEVWPGWLDAMVQAIAPGKWASGAVDYLALNSARSRDVWDVPNRRKYLSSTTSFIDRTFGCNCGFSRSMWEQVGGFDSLVSGSGGDETEMFMRAYGAGYRRRYVPQAIVSYRLRPGIRSTVRQRFRQGRTRFEWAACQAASSYRNRSP